MRAFVSAAAAAAVLSTFGSASAAVIANEDFEAGAAGWTNSTTEDGGANFSRFLGRFGNETFGNGNQVNSKTYALSGTQTQVNFSLNFYEVDSWDGEVFRVFVNGVQLFADAFQHNVDQGNASDAVRTRTRQLGNGTDNLGFGGFPDQTYLYTFSIATTATSITLGFGSGLDQGAGDEAWGVDNLVISDNARIGAAVPEPMSLALVGIGMLGLGAARRKIAR